ncbi:outer membrane lipoprotein SlyB [Rahnella sp. BIGb0236]|nr:outer membrane lipoprotein SlyB [Rahnella sp. BIGb0236]VTQ54040.1 YfgH [Campylobacter jejuni]
MKTKIAVSSFVLMALLTGCQSNADQYAADTFTTDQLNTRQETRTVNILSVLPAKITVNNQDNRNTATLVGSVLGAIAGGVAGYALGHGGDLAAVGGAVGGATLGGVTGSAVNSRNTVEGVSLSYKDDTKIYTSVQVGRACQFTNGLAVVFMTQKNETRIQPNSTCPAGK